MLNPMRKTTSDVAGDADLAGPLTFCLAFGALLLLSGKVHFNYIYGIGGLGCATIYGLLCLMNVRHEVSATVVVSTLGKPPYFCVHVYFLLKFVIKQVKPWVYKCHPQRK